MRKSRFNDEQIVAILRESDRTSVAEAAKKHKVSEQTILCLTQALRRSRAHGREAIEGAGTRERQGQAVTGDRAAFHPAREARSERLHRALQPHLPRGGTQRLPVRFAG